jgi:hypothetical protein
MYPDSVEQLLSRMAECGTRGRNNIIPLNLTGSPSHPAIGASLQSIVDREILPILSRPSGSAPGSRLQRAILGLPGKSAQMMETVAAAETCLGLRWAHLYQIAVPRRTATFVFLFENMGEPLFAEATSTAPVFALVFQTCASRQRKPAAAAAAAVEVSFVVRLSEDVNLADYGITVRTDRLWSPPVELDATDKIALLASAWLPPTALERTLLVTDESVYYCRF